MIADIVISNKPYTCEKIKPLGIVNKIDDNKTSKYIHKILYISVCILSCAVITLLISGLIIGSIHGKDDPTSQNLLISFAAIFGFMMISAIFGMIIVNRRTG